MVALIIYLVFQKRTLNSHMIPQRLTCIDICPVVSIARNHSIIPWGIVALCKKASNHHANLPLEMYSFYIVTTWENTWKTTGDDDLTL